MESKSRSTFSRWQALSTSKDFGGNAFGIFWTYAFSLFLLTKEPSENFFSTVQAFQLQDYLLLRGLSVQVLEPKSL